jgi:ribonuclease P protein component
MQLFPLRMLYLLEPADTYSVQAGFTVSSRHFKKATDRNRLKRLMREAYRTLNAPLRPTEGKPAVSLSIFFIFTGRELVDLAPIKEKTGLLIGRLENVLLNEVR